MGAHTPLVRLPTKASHRIGAYLNECNLLPALAEICNDELGAEKTRWDAGLIPKGVRP